MSIRVFNMRCNGFINPLGVDFNSIIRLCFSVNSSEKVLKTVLKCFSDKKSINDNILFSKVFKAGDDYSCFYSGSRLSERQKVLWIVEVYTKSGIYKSEIVFFETGLLLNSNNCIWIKNPNFNGNVSEFVKKFTVSPELNNARLYISGLGFFDSFINGQKTDSYYFKPNYTDYEPRPQLNIKFPKNKEYSTEYYTFDIKDKLSVGDNCLSVLLSDGWYNNVDKNNSKWELKKQYGQPKLFFKIYLDYGSRTEIIESDESCLVRNTNIFSTLFKGDAIDFTKKAEKLVKSEVIPSNYNSKMISPLTLPDEIYKEVKPISVVDNGNNSYIYDFGYNHTGNIRCFIKGDAGKKVVFKFAEVMVDGKLNFETSKWADETEDGGFVEIIQKSEYVLSGKKDFIEPKFCWRCYRYLLVESECPITVSDLSSVFICANLKNNCKFNCENQILNELVSQYKLTQYCNFHNGIESDCPHREKLPYTGDGQVIQETISYFFDAEQYYVKWLKDIINAQFEDGFVPYTAPYQAAGGGYNWSIAIANVPLKMYKFNGDKTPIENAYQAVKKFVAYLNGLNKDNYLADKVLDDVWFLGDWLPFTGLGIDSVLINTFCFFNTVKVAMEFAKIIGNKKDYKEFKLLSEKIKEEINNRFFDKEKLNYDEDGGGAVNALAIYLGVVPKKYILAVKEKIRNYYVNESKYHFDSGIVLTPIVLEALTKIGCGDIGYRLLTVNEGASYSEMLKGETTLCEHWSKQWPPYKRRDLGEYPGGGDVSHCHPMFGSVCAWIVKNVAGLSLEKKYKKTIVYSPTCLKELGGAEANKETNSGDAKIKWSNKDKLIVDLTVPLGYKGEVKFDFDKPLALINGKKIKQLKSKNGEYKLLLKSGTYTIKQV